MMKSCEWKRREVSDFQFIICEAEEEMEARKCEQFNFKRDLYFVTLSEKANYGGERNVYYPSIYAMPASWDGREKREFLRMKICWHFVIFVWF